MTVNPYSTLPIYNNDYIAMYKNRSREDTKPHIFAITDAAFRNMLEMKENQSILVTLVFKIDECRFWKLKLTHLTGVNRELGKQGIQKRLSNTWPLLPQTISRQSSLGRSSYRSFEPTLSWRHLGMHRLCVITIPPGLASLYELNLQGLVKLLALLSIGICSRRVGLYARVEKRGAIMFFISF